MLAESYYQQGLAQQFGNQFDEAKESYQRAINILQLRTEKLRAKLTMTTGEDAESERTTINDEISEIEALLPELSGKLEEVNEQGEQSVAAIKEAKECLLNTVVTSNGLPGINGADCKDITSMMKSKRKISGSAEEVVGMKKTRLSANGAPSSSTDENGVEMEETPAPAPTETAPIEEKQVVTEEKPIETTPAETIPTETIPAEAAPAPEPEQIA